jgi:hypothetical protein
MTKDEVLKMLSKSGLLFVGYNLKASDLRLFEFSNLVNDHIEEMVMQEREACAQICEQFADQDSGPDGIVTDYHAHLIRARSNK